jgi:hypothetical protein
LISAPLVDSEESGDGEELFQEQRYCVDHSDAEESHSSLNLDWDSADYNSQSDDSFENDDDIFGSLAEAKMDISDLHPAYMQKVGVLILSRDFP